MKLRVEYNVPSINIFSESLVDHTDIERICYIDDKRVPDNLAKIILLGLDVATEQYLHLIDNIRKENGLED